MKIQAFLMALCWVGLVVMVVGFPDQVGTYEELCLVVFPVVAWYMYQYKKPVKKF